MKNTAAILSLVAGLLAILTSHAQQSPSPATQPTQAQVQNAPCTAAPPTAPSPQANNSRPAIVDRWKKKLNEESAKLAKQTGVPMPTTDDLDKLTSAKLAPCPPKAGAFQVVPEARAAVIKLPSDTFVTLRCNPMTPSSQGGARQTTLTLPDPKDFASPKANDFLADSVVPDTAARTPCYLIKVDPKTGKSFVQQ